MSTEKNFIRKPSCLGAVMYSFYSRGGKGSLLNDKCLWKSRS